MADREARALLPCPFCGGAAQPEHLENGRWSIGCADADGECYGYQSLQTFARKADAVTAWNTRAPTVHADKVRQCAVCTATVAEYPEGMSCHCHEMPWPVAALAQQSVKPELRPMSEAPRDRYILAVYRARDEDRKAWDCRSFVVLHEGETSSGHDLGWRLFPGFGGVPDFSFYGWLPLPGDLLPPSPTPVEEDDRG